jgi:cytochrome c biogenesis protein CcmG, thiol:disulfide interchange protein DsbE
VKRAIWALVIGMPLILVLATGFGRDPSAIVSPLLNKPAPAFELRSIDNQPVALANLRGKPIVLNFWASWCDGCKYEHPFLLSAWRTYSPRGVKFLAIIYQDSASGARDFMRSNGGGWPVLTDPSQQTALNYGVVKLPETYFIDRRGIIRYKSLGPVTPTVLNQQIGRLLRTA